MKQLPMLIILFAIVLFSELALANSMPQILAIQNKLSAPIDVVVSSADTRCLSPTADSGADTSFFRLRSPVAGNQTANFPVAYTYANWSAEPCGSLSSEQTASYLVTLKDHNSGTAIGTITYTNVYDGGARHPICESGILTAQNLAAGSYKLNLQITNADSNCNITSGNAYQVVATVSYTNPTNLNFTISSDPNSTLTFTKDASNTNPDMNLADITAGNTVNASYTPNNQSVDGKLAYNVKDSNGAVLSGLGCIYSYHWNAATTQCAVDAPVAVNNNSDYQVTCPAAKAQSDTPGCTFTIQNMLSAFKSYNINVTVQNSITEPLQLQQQSGSGTYKNGPASTINPASSTQFTYATIQSNSNLDQDFVIYNLNGDNASACNFAYAIDTVNKACLTKPALNQPFKVSNGDAALTCEAVSANYNSSDNSCNITFNVDGQESRKFSVTVNNASGMNITRNSNLVPTDNSNYQGGYPPASIDKGAPLQTFVYTPLMSMSKKLAADDSGVCQGVAGDGNACVAYDLAAGATCELKYGWDANNKCYATLTPINNNPQQVINCVPAGTITPVQSGSNCSVNFEIQKGSTTPLTQINLNIVNDLFTDLSVGSVDSSQPYLPMPDNIEDGQVSQLNYIIPAASSNGGSQTLIYNLNNILGVTPLSCQLTFSWDTTNCYGQAVQVGGSSDEVQLFTNCNMAKFIGTRNANNSCNLSFIIGMPVQSSLNGHNLPLLAPHP